ncbi:MAG TPA: GGDEF domain-containing protein [Elusimicrobiota bacterium]|nr:GGDEF domain-containing protein [Elusimicrobiota bacterium]HMZ27505.1 GGDEF domain-containing protein [Elusimicrobiota bacterium]HND64353.1 GGDEF domain-containing protein [Elusimicrobiota bacterium]HNF59076.1 GGDEF domain-containing protein [Elusimicrobiota bacterium]HNI56329.1 GGDEF domain-containing protein [Elusimicrobiota bacterium]
MTPLRKATPLAEPLISGGRSLRRLDRFLAGLERQSNGALEMEGVGFLLALGALDGGTGPDVSLLLFYLVPVFWYAWFLGRRHGLLMALAAAVVEFTVDLKSAHAHPPPVIGLWNAAAKAGFFAVAALLLTALRRSFEQERRLAQIDPLTGVLNRRAFVDRLRLEVDRSRRRKSPLTLIYLDVDHFKDINDRWGHPAGDRILKSAVATLRKDFRRTDAVARLGGDEFAVLLPDTDAPAADTVIRKMRAHLSAPRGDDPRVTFSFGAVTFLRPPDDVELLIQEADRLMYEVKRAGRNNVRHETWNSPVGEAVG